MGVIRWETMWREGVVSLLGPLVVAAARRRREAAPEAHYFPNPRPLYQLPPVPLPVSYPFFKRPPLPSYSPFLPPSLAHHRPFHYPPITDHVHLPHIHIVHPPPSLHLLLLHLLLQQPPLLHHRQQRYHLHPKVKAAKTTKDPQLDVFLANCIIK